MSYNYLVIIEKSESGYSAYSPDVPGCVATGKTASAVEAAMSEAIEFHLEGLVQAGEAVPRPQAQHTFARVGHVKPRESTEGSPYHIVPVQGQWVVRRTGASRASRILSSKVSAVQHAKRLARKQSVRVLVHNMDGTVHKIELADSRKSGKSGSRSGKT